MPVLRVLRPSPGSRTAWTSIVLLSCAINVLALAGAIYAMQVFDRVLTSRSLDTLVALSVLVVGICAALAAFDLLRSQLLQRIATRASDTLMPSALRAMRKLGCEGKPHGEALLPPRDVDTVRSYLAGPGPVAVLDLPWTLVFLAFVWLLHPYLGLAALAGLMSVLAMAAIGNGAVTGPEAQAHFHAAARLGTLDAALRNGETTAAMGLAAAVDGRIETHTAAQVTAQVSAGDVAAAVGGTTRALRLGLQAAVTGLGAWLALAGELSAGAIIAASICAARVLAPVEQVIASWRILLAARASMRRLAPLVEDDAPRLPRIEMPAPTETLAAERLTLIPPGGTAPTLLAASLTLHAGEVLAVVGPSGAGKSTLLRGLAGVWPASDGAVRLDGAPLERWDPAARGAWIGYMPQQVAFFPATIAENIARLDPMPDSASVIAAARAAGMARLIADLPEGYSTRIGTDGSPLSVGQRQQLALARAIFDNPFLVVLDEPNANLDAAGEAALTTAIAALRRRRSIVVVATHRRSLLAAADRVAVLELGRIRQLTTLAELDAPSARPDRQRLAVAGSPSERVLETIGGRAP